MAKEGISIISYSKIMAREGENEEEAKMKKWRHASII